MTLCPVCLHKCFRLVGGGASWVEERYRLLSHFLGARLATGHTVHSLPAALLYMDHIKSDPTCTSEKERPAWK
jgi:hypothetical protein